MKALIWIACFFVATILNTLLGYATGFKVGYMLFYFAVYFVAKKLCNKWDEHAEAKKEQKKNAICVNFPDTKTIANSADKICFCRKCGTQLIDNSNFCRKCGKEIIKE